MAIPAGVIVAWPYNLSEKPIPSGWTRVTALNGRHAKCVPNASTDPGATGGAATHTHTTSGHTHSIGSHSHTTGNTSAASGTINRNSYAVAGSSVQQRTNHTHTRPTTNASSAVNSGSASPALQAASNDPASLTTIYIESDGTPETIPLDAVAWGLDALEDWDNDADLWDKFLKGTSSDVGGEVIGSDSHTHTVAAHTHSGASHGHSSGVTGLATTTSIKDATGPTSNHTVLGGANHDHPITINAANTGTLQSASGGTSGSGSTLPPWFGVWNLRRNRISSGFSQGLIAAWLGTLATIPDGWALCDGTNGTPNLLGRYLRDVGIAGTTGGGGSHSHTTPSHTHGIGSHSHSVTIGNTNDTATSASVGTGTVHSSPNHNHSGTSNTNSTTPSISSASSGTSSSVTIEPPYREVAFIMNVGATTSDSIEGVAGIVADGETAREGDVDALEGIGGFGQVAFTKFYHGFIQPGQPLKWLGGQIDVRVEIATLLVPEDGGIWNVSEWDNAMWTTSDLGWQDLTDRVEAVEIDRGQERWDSRFQAGVVSITFNNQDGIFSQGGGADTWGVQFRPGREIRVVAVPDPTDPMNRVPLFTGRIDASNDEFMEAGGNIVTVVTAVDALGELHNNNPLALLTATGVQSSDERVNAALDRADWPEDKREIDTGEHNVQTSFLAQTTLEEIQRAAEAEGGALYADAANNVVFKARDWLSSNTRSTVIQRYLGFTSNIVPENADAYAIVEVETEWELATVRNDIQFSRTGGTVQQAEDEDSIVLHGRRSYPRLDFINNTDDDVAFLANRHLQAYKDSRSRITSVTVAANQDPGNEDLNRILWDSEFGDLLKIRIKTLRGWEVIKNVHLIGISHTITPDDWVMRLTLDDALVDEEAII